jgi:hypothetical protein
MSFLSPNRPLDAADPAVFTQCSSDTALPAAAVMQQIEGWTDLAVRRRQDFIGAVNKVCAVAGLPPETLLQSPEKLRATVLTRSAAAWGLKAASKSNVLSRLRVVL